MLATMEFTPVQVPDATERRAYLGWRNKYANEPRRCREYESRFAGKPGRAALSWLDARMVRRALGTVPPGSVVLDLPCGGGRLTRALERSGYRVLPADFSHWMVRESSSSAREGVRADALRLPFRDGAFPAAVCFRFLHSLPPALRNAALRELGRVARVVVVNYLNALSIRSMKRFVLGGRQLWNRVTEAQAVAEVEAAGLRVSVCRYKAKLLFEDFVVVARGFPRAEESAPEEGENRPALWRMLER